MHMICTHIYIYVHVEFEEKNMYTACRYSIKQDVFKNRISKKKLR